MKKRSIQPITLSAWQFSQHIGKTQGNVSAALKANGTKANKGGEYSLKELVRAMMSPSGLKQQAEDARYQKQIDEAQVFADKVKANKRDLLPKKEVQTFIEDVQTKVLQIIRHSKLSEQEKSILIRQLKELKFE